MTPTQSLSRATFRPRSTYQLQPHLPEITGKRRPIGSLRTTPSFFAAYGPTVPGNRSHVWCAFGWRFTPNRCAFGYGRLPQRRTKLQIFRHFRSSFRVPLKYCSFTVPKFRTLPRMRALSQVSGEMPKCSMNLCDRDLWLAPSKTTQSS